MALLDYVVEESREGGGGRGYVLGEVLIYHTPATSISNQAALMARALSGMGYSVTVLPTTSYVSAHNLVKERRPDLIIQYLDPLAYPYFSGGNVVNYWVADGVPVGDTAKYVRFVCESASVNLAASSYAKSNMEEIGCFIDSKMPAAVDTDKYRPVPVNPSLDLGVVMGFNYGMGEPFMDRNATPQLVGVLHSMWLRGYRFTAWLHTNADFLTFYLTKFGGRLTISYNIMNRLTTLTPESNGFFTFDKPSPDHPVKLSMIEQGSIDPLNVYASSRFTAYTALAGSFGLPPFESLAVGRPVIVNDIPPIREWLPSNSCVERLPIHSFKQYVWGVGYNKLVMNYAYPDYAVLREVLSDKFTGWSVDARACADSVSAFDYRKVYSGLARLID